MNMSVGGLNLGGPIVKKDTCSTCPKKIRLSDGRLECRAMPPVCGPILGPGPGGTPQVIGETNSFPHPEPDWFCWQHPARQMQLAVGNLRFEDVETNDK